MSCHRLVLACLLIAFAGMQSVAAGEKYFLLMFGAQQFPKDPDYAHTFATFVRQTDCAEGRRLEVRTISWLPLQLPPRILRLRPETGRNYELHETMRGLLALKERVSMWGPYEIEPELYELAGKQIDRLNSGAIRYKAFDAFYGNNNVTNCIHAVAGLTERGRLRVFTPAWGDSASYFVLNKLLPWVVDPLTTHDHLVGEMGLDAYPIAYRKPFERHLLPPATGLRLLVHDALPEPTYGPPAVRGRAGR
jgi:hypothetical protein